MKLARSIISLKLLAIEKQNISVFGSLRHTMIPTQIIEASRVRRKRIFYQEKLSIKALANIATIFISGKKSFDTLLKSYTFVAHWHRKKTCHRLSLLLLINLNQVEP